MSLDHQLSTPRNLGEEALGRDGKGATKDAQITGLPNCWTEQKEVHHVPFLVVSNIDEANMAPRTLKTPCPHPVSALCSSLISVAVMSILTKSSSG